MVDPPLLPRILPLSPITQDHLLEATELLTTYSFPNASTPTAGVGIIFPRESSTIQATNMTRQPQEPQDPLLGVARAPEEALDESFVFGTPSFLALESPIDQDIGAILEGIHSRKRNADNSEDDDDVVEDEEPTKDTGATSKPPKKKRNKFSYSKKKLLGEHTLYLNPIHKTTWFDKYGGHPVQLIGQIVTCPNKRNGDNYTIEWETAAIDMNPSWVITVFKKTKELQSTLKSAMEAYNDHPVFGVCIQPTTTTNIEAPPRRSPHHSLAMTSLPTPPMPPLRRSPRNSNETSSPTPPIPQFRRSPRRSNPQPRQQPVSTPVRGAMALASMRTAPNLTPDNLNEVADNLTPEQHVPNLNEVADNLTPEQHVPRTTSARRSLRSNPDTDLSDSEDDNVDLDETDDAWYHLPDGTELMDVQVTEDVELNRNGSIAQSISGTVSDFLNRLEWTSEVIEPGSIPFQQTRGIRDDATTLKRGIARSFDDPMECLAKCTGFNKGFVARLVRNSNIYAKNNILPNKRNGLWHSLKWEEITIEEMYRFLGIVLHISLSPVDGGGYKAYFAKNDKEIVFNKKMEGRKISNSHGFANNIMTLRRFQQIRGAFHPEEKVINDNDKCYQLRHAIRTFNSKTKKTFSVGGKLTFDEGGVACRSRLCPVRQYNSNKPQKFCVDFFILSDAREYCILHIDVYQGKNSSNVGIHPDLIGLGTTQKAVMNAVYQMGLNDDTSADARHIAMDNRYQCPELAVLLRERAGVLSTGTVRVKRKGWDKTLMCLGVRGRPVRGQFKMVADKTNEIICMQWMDSKVVSLVTTTNITTVGTVKRQVGSNAVEFRCPDALIQYQRTMFGVDKGDQFRMHGGGFSNKAHFKKWYKKTYLAILDCMLMNAVFAWNMAVKEDSSKLKLARHDFMHVIAQDMMEYTDPDKNNQATRPSFRNVVEQDWTCEHTMENCCYGERCAVCKLEANLDKLQGEMAKKVVVCKKCRIPAHPAVQDKGDRMIHKFPEFKGMSCFAIIHSVEGRKIWIPKPEGNKQKYSVNRSHRIVQALRQHHGKPARAVRSRRSSEDNE